GTPSGSHGPRRRGSGSPCGGRQNAAAGPRHRAAVSCPQPDLRGLAGPAEPARRGTVPSAACCRPAAAAGAGRRRPPPSCCRRGGGSAGAAGPGHRGPGRLLPSPLLPMAGNFWQSSHYLQWILDKQDLLKERQKDLKFLTEEEYWKLQIFFTNGHTHFVHSEVKLSFLFEGVHELQDAVLLLHLQLSRL
uniref:Cyclin C n=1 Tax=Falco tinnunculus TaxID=100819 RepID=A0A8C4U477_FALTI